MAIWVLRKYTPPAHTGEKSARKKRGVAFLGVVATSGGKRFGDLCSMHFSRRGKGVKRGPQDLPCVEIDRLRGWERLHQIRQAITATRCVCVMKKAKCMVIAVLNILYSGCFTLFETLEHREEAGMRGLTSFGSRATDPFTGYMRHV